MNQLYDKSGKPIRIVVEKPANLIPMSKLFEEICKKLNESISEVKHG